jgi:H+-transporting ATPase
MHPLGWGWACFVWGYAIAWALLNDRVKLLAYRILDPTKPSLLAKKPKDQTPQDLRPEVAARAYELFEKRGSADAQAAGDWAEAEREIDKEHLTVTK